MANIRIGDAAVMSLAVSSVRLSFWSCVWRFLHAPTQQPLLCIEVLGAHVRVVVKETPSQREAIGTNVRRDDPMQRLAALFDLDVSFKDTRHKAWTPVCKWIHRCHFVCYFVHLVAFSVSSVAVEVVHENATNDQVIVTLKVSRLPTASWPTANMARA